MGGSLFIVVIVVVVLALILWPIISGFGSKAAGQTDTRAGALADQERPDLQLATAVTPTGAGEAEEKQFPLHAVHPGSPKAVCGVEVAEVLDGTTWPPDPAAACSACAEALTGEGTPPPRDAT